MATRFPLPSSGAAAVSPSFQSYSHSGSTRRALPTSDSSSLTTTAQTPDSGDHLVAGDTFHVQFVSGTMAAGIAFVTSDTVKYAIQALEAHTNNNLFVQLFVSVVSSDGTTVRATLLSKSADATELATSLTSRTASHSLTSGYTTVLGDRLVVEFSVTGTPAAAGGTQGHNASLRWGANGAGGDLLENDSQTGTTLNPWIEFSRTITFAQFATVNQVTESDAAQAIAKAKAKAIGQATETDAAQPITRYTPPSAITVDAAEFDGTNDHLSRSSFLSDGSQITFTGFFNTSSSGTTKIVGANNAGLFINFPSAGDLYGEFYSASSAQSLTFTASVGGLNDGQWHSFLVSADTNFSSGNKLLRVVIDGVLDTPSKTDNNIAFNIGLDGDAYVGASPGPSQRLNGCLAEITFNPQYIDFSDSVNIRKFVTASGKPADIGTDGSSAYGAAAAVYLHLDDGEAAANFAVNAGTGGNFTVTGALATCASSPSDVVPQTVAIGQATETDLAQPITRVKSKDTGQATETDLAQAISRRKTRTLGQPTETDAAQAITWNPKRRLLGQPSETDLSQPITRRKIKALGQPSETDLAQPILWNPKRRLVNQTTETDLAQAISRLKAKAIGQTTETDLSQPITGSLSGFPLTGTVNQASETDAAQPISRLKTRTLGQATEADLAQAIARRKAKTLGQPFEADAAQVIQWAPKTRLVNQAFETDFAYPITADTGVSASADWWIVRARRRGRR